MADQSYLKLRANDERAAALRAQDPRARDIHLELAARYENLFKDEVIHELFGRPPSYERRG